MTYRAPGWNSIALAAAIALAASALLALSRPVIISVDGQRVESDVPAVTTLADDAYVPLRSLADALGAQTEVQGDTIVVTRGRESMRIKIGDTHATINGLPFTIKHAPFRVRGRVMIGLRPVADAFDVRATYDARRARITILTPGIGEATSVVPPTAQ